MAYAIDQKQFNKLIGDVTKSRASFRRGIQDALIAATYLCIKHSNGTTPFQQILDAAGTTAHRQGITKWAETFAPVQLEHNKIVGNKTAYKLLDVEAIVKDFDAFIEETGMANVMWDEIAKDENTTVSVFDLNKTFDSFLKKLEKNELSGLAAALRKAEQDYLAGASNDKDAVKAA